MLKNGSNITRKIKIGEKTMISYIKRLVRKGDTVLFKASNAMRFHEIIAESGLAHKDE